MTTDEARERLRLIADFGDDIEYIDAFEAAVRAEYGDIVVMTAEELRRRWPASAARIEAEVRAESAQELAALREAAETVARGFEASAPLGEWDKAALSLLRGALAATPAEDWMTLVPDDPNDRTTEFADERAATPAEDGEYDESKDDWQFRGTR